MVYSSTMDSPDQNAYGIPVTTTSFDRSILKLAVTIAQIEYRGTLDKDNAIIGNFMQAGQSFPLNLARGQIDSEKTIRESIPKDTNFVEHKSSCRLKPEKSWNINSSKGIHPNSFGH